MEEGKQLVLWGPSQEEHKGQRKGIPGSQVSDSWVHLIRKQPAGKGGERLTFGGMQAETND